MSLKSTIETYNVRSFLERYVRSEGASGELLKSGFGKFFVVKVQDLLPLITLPVHPTRATVHTLIYLTEGEAVMTIGSETWTIHKDECLVVAAGQVFSFGNRDVNTGYQCSFHNDFLLGRYGVNDPLKDFEFLRIWGNPRVPLDGETSDFVAHLFRRMLHDYMRNGLNNPDILHSYLLALLCEVNRAYRPVPTGAKTAAVNITNSFKELLVEQIKTRHLVSDYAALLNITPNHLNKVVRTTTGKSAIRWINEALVLEAKILLCHSDLSVGEVAAEVGLFDQSYFSRLFKRGAGVTPLEFRRMIEKS